MVDVNNSAELGIKQSEKKVSRRFFLRKAAAVTAVAVPAMLGVDAITTGYMEGKVPSNPQPIPTAEPAKIIQFPRTENSKNAPVASKEENSKEQEIDIEKLNNIAVLPLGDRRRNALEQRYVNEVKNVKQADAGFLVLTDPDLRAQLLKFRYNERLKRRGGLVPLSELDEAWAFQNKVHPEVLGVCMDAYPRAKAIIEKLLEKSKANFRPDLLYKLSLGQFPPDAYKNLTAEQLMINPGGLTELACSETGYERICSTGEPLIYGFSFVGSGAAEKYINDKIFPTGKEALRIICQRLERRTGIKYVPENIIGSAPSDKDASGGAIGTQFMPDNALLMMDLFESVGEFFNPFDVRDQMTAVYVFLAMGHEVHDGYRYGYIRDILPGGEKLTEAIRNDSLAKWNPHDGQRDRIIKAAYSFFNREKELAHLIKEKKENKVAHNFGKQFVGGLMAA